MHACVNFTVHVYFHRCGQELSKTLQFLLIWMKKLSWLVLYVNEEFPLALSTAVYVKLVLLSVTITVCGMTPFSALIQSVGPWLIKFNYSVKNFTFYLHGLTKLMHAIWKIFFTFQYSFRHFLQSKSRLPYVETVSIHLQPISGRTICQIFVKFSIGAE